MNAYPKTVSTVLMKVSIWQPQPNVGKLRNEKLSFMSLHYRVTHEVVSSLDLYLYLSVLFESIFPNPGEKLNAAPLKDNVIFSVKELYLTWVRQ